MLAKSVRVIGPILTVIVEGYFARQYYLGYIHTHVCMHMYIWYMNVYKQVCI